MNANVKFKSFRFKKHTERLTIIYQAFICG